MPSAPLQAAQAALGMLAPGGQVEALVVLAVRGRRAALRLEQVQAVPRGLVLVVLAVEDVLDQVIDPQGVCQVVGVHRLVAEGGVHLLALLGGHDDSRVDRAVAAGLQASGCKLDGMMRERVRGTSLAQCNGL